MTYEEIKKQRLRFLQKLYDLSKSNPSKRFGVYQIGDNLDLDHDTIQAIIEYLHSEGLIRNLTWSPSRGISGNDEVSITHEGIKEIEAARNNPQNSTQHFPPYQLVYNIRGNYIERDRVMGDVFRDIQNATIINKSLVENSFNKVKREHDEETSKALVKVAEFIENSKDPAAGALFNNFNEELNKPQPDKSRLKSFWTGIEKALPTITTIAGAVAKIAPLFI
jgi:predicted transcriptional regulator